MKQVLIRAYGGPEELKVETAERQLPGPGQILVEVEAAGVNYLDVAQRQGYMAIPLPFTLGLEGVGRIVAVGEDVREFAVGRRVAWINSPNSYASEVLVPAQLAIDIPQSLTAEQALLCQAVTVEYLVTEYRSIKAGDRVLVHSAAGGVGQLLVQWLKHLGAWVAGTVSNDSKAVSAKNAGADLVINYGGDYAFLDELMDATGGLGVDLAFDAVGAATFANSVKALARGGTAVSYGAASGPVPPVDLMQLHETSARIAGASLFSYTADPAELRRRARAAIAGIEQGWLAMGQSTAYELERAADAHRDIQGRGTQGKLYLKP